MSISDLKQKIIHRIAELSIMAETEGDTKRADALLERKMELMSLLIDTIRVSADWYNKELDKALEHRIRANKNNEERARLQKKKDEDFSKLIRGLADGID